MDDRTALGACELAQLIRAGDVSPVEVLQSHRNRAEALNSALNAIVTPIEAAEGLAVEAERAVRRGDAVGPLHGVPFTIKDSFDTAGVRTVRGSRLFADHVPDTDAAVYERLLAGGAIPLGKTNVPEFVLWWETDNLVFGMTRNPWNPERTAGAARAGGSGNRSGALTARDRQRPRRLDPVAGELLRRRRAQADPRRRAADRPLARRRPALHARGPARALVAGHRARALGGGRPRRSGLALRPGASSPYPAGTPISQACASASWWRGSGRSTTTFSRP